MTLLVRFHDWLDRHFGVADHVKVDEDRAHEHLYGERRSSMIQWPITPIEDAWTNAAQLAREVGREL